MAEETKDLVGQEEQVVASEETTSKASETKNEPTMADLQAQLQELMTQNAKLKRASDKNSAEASEYKKKWKASMSEVELANTERAEQEAEREEQYKVLLRENQINKVEKSYLAMGYTGEEANRMAVAETDNDFEEKVKIMAEVEARKKKEYEAEWLKSRPPVNAGIGGEDVSITREEFNKLGYKELVEFQAKYPETYKTFTS